MQDSALAKAKPQTVWIVSVGERCEGSSVRHVYSAATAAHAKAAEIEKTLLSCDYVKVQQFVMEA